MIVGEVKTPTKKKRKRNVCVAPERVRDGGFGVLLFNCYCHTFDSVVLQLQKATGCSESQAVQYATLAEQFGEVMVYRGTQAQCDSVARILTDIGLDVSVVPH